MPQDSSDRKSRTITAAGLPERRRGQRREDLFRALLHGSFMPRRRGPRRAGEHPTSSVDWHHPQWLAIAMLIVVFSGTDAFLTLLLVDHGAHEVNPLMAPLIGGTGVAFALVKIGLTGPGVVLLTQVARRRAFGRLPVGLLLYSALAFYVVLIAYELRLLSVF